ncbi:MAG TPA: hypothetical protein VHS81_13195 [Caulobacteraceae bacterium]|nr:hypothetical protein [Caulobacteraceae bacterium]
MTTLGPSPFVWLQFDQNGALTEPDNATQALNQALAVDGVRDLLVLAHGWQTDLPGAQGLYSRLWGNVCPALSGIDPAKVVVAGVLWPSKPYNADYDGGQALSVSEASGGVLSTGGQGPGVADLPQDRFEQVLSDIQTLVGAQVDTAALVAAARAAAANSTAAYGFFAEALKVLGVDPSHPDPELAQTASLFGKAGTSFGAQVLLSAYAAPLALPIAPGVGAALGLGDVINTAVQGARNAVAKALNLMSYFTMKARAGVVGDAMGAHVLPPLAAPSPVRLHLVGHSFGARLVTAAANSFAPHGALRLQTLTLLEGAYSQNGMTAGRGPYSAVLGKVPGPIAMTHTHNDLACTLAYPLASRLSGDTTLSIGDKNDPYGAMGANGAQLAASLLAPDSAATSDFAPVKGKVNRFLADAYVIKTADTDAHNNVYNPSCGKLVAAVIAS